MAEKTIIMRKVAHILQRKGKNVVSVLPSLTVLEALKMMADMNIGSLAVMDEGKFLGIMTERDYSRKVILKGRSSTDTTVGEIMSPDFPAVSENDSVEHCMKLMSEKNLRYLPVMENNQLNGILSINDVVTETILMQQETISHLENYIQS